MATLAWFAIALLLMLVGLVGVVLPLLPGLPLVLAGGGSRAGLLGAMLGLLVGPVLGGPIGLLSGPYVGAVGLRAAGRPD